MPVTDQCSINIACIEVPKMCIKLGSSFLGRSLPWLTAIPRHSQAILSQSMH